MGMRDMSVKLFLTPARSSCPEHSLCFSDGDAKSLNLQWNKVSQNSLNSSWLDELSFFTSRMNSFMPATSALGMERPTAPFRMWWTSMAAVWESKIQPSLPTHWYPVRLWWDNSCINTSISMWERKATITLDVEALITSIIWCILSGGSVLKTDKAYSTQIPSSCAVSVNVAMPLLP